MTEQLPPGAFTASSWSVYNVGLQRLQRRFTPLGRVSKSLLGLQHVILCHISTSMILIKEIKHQG